MPSNLPLPANPFVRTYDLAAARRHAKSARDPRAHQLDALRSLKAWFDVAGTKDAPRGGLLVLPTGGGKTFTAVRFLCEWPLSEGYKVLWLAHTHHLLEQAFDTFGPAVLTAEQPAEVGKIREPRQSLQVRVVSGMPGHAKVRSLREDDDVIVGSLQTFANAQRDDHERLTAFIDSARGKLVVVFDEAHHAPAPTYARFVEALRHRVPSLRLLGLTATPVYDNKLRAGWLRRLFPQDIVFQTTVTRLLADRVLAKPKVEEFSTHFKADFDDRAFARWTSTYGDLPPEIIETLAQSRERNDCIVNAYVAHRAKYGKTLIFADRWYQCDYLREALRRHGVKADVVYSHVDAQPGTVDARNRRTADENTAAIRAFKRGELDVLVNVRMLTEGTDVPQVQSVFLTRQTTSRVLLTQMVGRALRGPAFGGTEVAYIVSFLDDWKQLINWAEFSLGEGLTDDRPSESRARLPVQLVSIALIRQLAAQMYKPAAERPATFLETVPVGWYRVEFDTAVGEHGDVEHVDRLVLVYEADREGFGALLRQLAKEDLTAFREPAVDLAAVRASIDPWVAGFFPNAAAHLGGDLAADVFHVARHMAQSLGEAPPFFPFESRSSHDLDRLAQTVFERNVGHRDVPGIVMAEFSRADRFWRSLYGSYEVFRDQFDLVLRRIENDHMRGGQPQAPTVLAATPERYVEREVAPEVKLAVKQRDGMRCLCCGCDVARLLEVDHIIALHHGGSHEMENLQTLCKPCNKDKGINEENFRVHATRLVGRHGDFVIKMEPGGDDPRDRAAWERCVRATINHYYRCAAVNQVEIGVRGARYYEWRITLFPGNDPRFIEAHLQGFVRRARERRRGSGQDSPTTLVLEGSDGARQSQTVRVGGAT